MSSSLRRLTRCAVLTALALALSVAEGLVPLTILFPLPGLRLGLANLVTVYALCRLSGREALLILAARCLLGALLGGNLMALAFSLTGGLLALGVMVEGGQVVGAGGVLVQPLPGCPKETLARLEALAPHLAKVSAMARAAGNAQELAKAALADFSRETLEARQPRFACDCSRERIERALLSMGETEMRGMIAEQHGAQVSCHFCNKVYDFTEADLLALLDEGKAEGGTRA